MPLLPHTQQKLAELILADLVAGQSTADSTAGRIRISTVVVERVARALVDAGQLGTREITIGNGDALTVYHLPHQSPPGPPIP